MAGHRLTKRIIDLETRAGDMAFAQLEDARLVLDCCEAIEALCDKLDANGEPEPDGLREALDAADWSKVAKILEGLKCEI